MCDIIRGKEVYFEHSRTEALRRYRVAVPREDREDRPWDPGFRHGGVVSRHNGPR